MLETELAEILCREELRLTGIGHESDMVTHHTHLVQTRLPIEEDEATNASGETSVTGHKSTHTPFLR